jgi:hypothetical protein
MELLVRTNGLMLIHCLSELKKVGLQQCIINMTAHMFGLHLKIWKRSGKPQVVDFLTDFCVTVWGRINKKPSVRLNTFKMIAAPDMDNAKKPIEYK